MKTVAIIQARMASTRLHGKVLAEAAGKPLLVHMVERLKRCTTLDNICVASPNRKEDLAIWKTLDGKADWYMWNGSEDDVLGRVLWTATCAHADVIVEMTADCPLLDPKIVDEVVTTFVEAKNRRGLCANTIEVRDALGFQDQPTYPRGMDVRVFSTQRLAYVAKRTQDPADREHVSLYFWEHPDKFRLQWVPAPSQLASDDRLTVDTPKDLAVVRGIFDALYPANPEFGLGEILAFLAIQPGLRRLNRSVQQKVVR